jgi:hypothetical protein
MSQVRWRLPPPSWLRGGDSWTAGDTWAASLSRPMPGRPQAANIAVALTRVAECLTSLHGSSRGAWSGSPTVAAARRCSAATAPTGRGWAAWWRRRSSRMASSRWIACSTSARPLSPQRPWPAPPGEDHPHGQPPRRCLRRDYGPSCRPEDRLIGHTHLDLARWSDTRRQRARSVRRYYPACRSAISGGGPTPVAARRPLLSADRSPLTRIALPPDTADATGGQQSILLAAWYYGCRSAHWDECGTARGSSWIACDLERDADSYIV